MELSTTFTTTPKTVLQSYRACHRTAYVVRWVAAVGLVVLGIARADLVPVVVAIAFFAFAEWSVRRQLKPYLSGPRTVTLTVTDEEYRTQGADRATARTWTAFASVRRVGAFWVLRISNMAALGLPADALDEKQTADFVALMRAKGLVKDRA
jgi:hypothetical protein